MCSLISAHLRLYHISAPNHVSTRWDVSQPWICNVMGYDDFLPSGRFRKCLIVLDHKESGLIIFLPLNEFLYIYSNAWQILGVSNPYFS